MDNPPETLNVIDPQGIVNALIELQVALRKISFYSLSHAITPGLLGKLGKHFNSLFEAVDQVTLGVTRHEFLYQGNPLTAANPVIRELARTLNQIGLAGITFLKGLTEADIFKFLDFLIEGRKQPPEQKEERVSLFHSEVGSIRLKLIHFGGALKNPGANADSPNPQKTDQEGREFWRGLVRQLAGESSENSQEILDSTEPKTESDNLAELINRLCQGNKKVSHNYERTIVKYLNKQTETQSFTEDQRIHLNRELSAFLSHLKPDVREQIFRITMEEAQKGDAPAGELLDFLPEPMLLELLKQIQISNENISAPMFSLLNKFTDIASHNKNVEDLLASKMGPHLDVFRELMTSRANRAYYPAPYRSLLDHELNPQPGGKDFSQTPGITVNDPKGDNQHLALIILELLEDPISSREEFESLMGKMNRLFCGGLGEKTPAMLQDTLQILLKKISSADDENRPLLQKEIKILLKPEMLLQLVQIDRTKGNHLDENLLKRITEHFNAEIIPSLLDLLETEENMSVRKNLLAWLVHCGPDVIPLAVKRLSNPKWFIVRNMLVLLLRLDARKALPDIARCMQKVSPKVKMAALQAIETLGRGTDYFYEAVSAGLVDKDHGVFRKSLSMVLSRPDPRSIQLIDGQLKYSNLSKSDGRFITVLEMIRKTKARELLPLLGKLRRQLRIRFWHWSQTRRFSKAIGQAVHDLQREQ